ncbi:Thioredoxin [Bathymodiolus heckerae thiotrophic gill symbiont]|uniref:thioredoxin TrxC n=1 Tax=Bathymodiolus heckerae thiotrophic gill symbiont TaxID=1052212 RepID=UPI0010AF682A|nr:thioredoxin TrxC [Bathymodiolus heckerae thiotrophic gill symbiont]CAC9583712.1 Thioredoxin 2 [uncultured Gammaproteobacteria bacterium]SHN93018.1 Thioredoxin [Bathymodiolus heckerae thiotrophic gill symbiont]
MIVMCTSCGGLNNIPEEKLSNNPNCGKCKNPLYKGEPISMTGIQLTRAIEKTDELLVVDFWATWCGPCKQFAPTFKQAASQLEPKARFIKIETEVEQAISAKYSIRSIPTLVMFKNGKEINRVSGALSAPDFTNWVNQHA